MKIYFWKNIKDQFGEEDRKPFFFLFDLPFFVHGHGHKLAAQCWPEGRSGEVAEPLEARGRSRPTGSGTSAANMTPHAMINARSGGLAHGWTDTKAEATGWREGQCSTKGRVANVEDHPSMVKFTEVGEGGEGLWWYQGISNERSSCWCRGQRDERCSDLKMH